MYPLLDILQSPASNLLEKQVQIVIEACKVWFTNKVPDGTAARKTDHLLIDADISWFQEDKAAFHYSVQKWSDSKKCLYSLSHLSH